LPALFTVFKQHSYKKTEKLYRECENFMTMETMQLVIVTIGFNNTYNRTDWSQIHNPTTSGTAHRLITMKLGTYTGTSEQMYR
jgi:hypothetical protein